MNLLADTRALLWWLAAKERISPSALDVLRNPSNRIYVTAAVGWEQAIKVNLGVIDGRELVSDLPGVLLNVGFRRLAISMDTQCERVCCLGTTMIRLTECWQLNRKR